MIKSLRFALGAALLACIGLAVSLPVHSAPSSYVLTTPVLKTTYRAAIVGLAPAASATDFFTIVGSATKTIYVKSVECNGTSTAAATATVALIKRSAANTAGTSTSPAAVPLDSGYVAATGVVKAYTANPSALGAAVGTIGSGVLTTTTAATPAVAANTLRFSFGADQGQFVVLRGVAQTLSLNGNAASFTAGAALNCSVEWIEL